MERFLSSADLLRSEVKGRRIVVIGAGGIGSFTVLALAKMGFTNIHVVDFDKIEKHNVDNQLYGEVHLGQYKVAALATLVKVLANVSITPVNKKADTIKLPDDSILIFAVDSMDTRIELFTKMEFNGWFIDGRMGALLLNVYTYNMGTPLAAPEYRSNLYPSSEALPAPCTAKSIMFTPFVAGGLIANQIKRICMGETVAPFIQYDFERVS